MSEEAKKHYNLLKGYLPLATVVGVIISVASIAVGIGWNNAVVAANTKAIEGFPSTYVSKAEFNATVKAMTDSLQRIDTNTQAINQTLLKYKFEITN